MTNLTNRVIELNEDGLTIAKIRATLTLEDYTGKEISAAIKEAGISSAKRGFASDFYDFLAKEQRLESEALEMIMAGSDNVIKHKSHYLAIWELSNNIWNK